MKTCAFSCPAGTTQPPTPIVAGLRGNSVLRPHALWSSDVSTAACVHSAQAGSRALQWGPSAATFSQKRQHTVSCRASAAPSSVGSDIGVVIVDHGSRKRDSNEMLVHFGLMYQQMTGAKIVEIAHMEIAEPTIEQAVGKCAAAGAKTVVVAPYFLSKGRHIQEDIPKLLTEAQAKYTGVKCVLAGPIGVDPLMAQIIQNRVETALRETV